MTFSINFENSSLLEIGPEQVDSFSFVCSIFKLYSGIKFILKDVTKSINNKIQTGMPVTVYLYENENKYEHNMSVLSYNKIVRSEQDVCDFFEIVLVSRMRYDEFPETKSYFGSVSTIISEILKNKFKTSIKKSNITSTDDLPRRRYQLAEKPQDFMKRILKYGMKEKYPVYLYFDAKGILNLGSVYDMFTSEAKYLATSALTNEINNLPSDSKEFTRLTFFDYTMGVNIKNLSSEVESIFSVSNFRCNNNILGSLNSKTLEYNNSQTYIKSPKKIVYYNWNLAPNDALSISAKNVFEETANSYVLSASFTGCLVNSLNVGNLVYIILPYDASVNNNKNLGEGKYLITGLEFSYENKVERTTVTMIQVAS